MGAIADQLKNRLDEMHARHAQTDREILKLKAEAEVLLAEVNRTHDRLMDCLQ